jgi:Tol biopolymer transport system component/DNA-binding winged helix-turn-helix (wHTH) protein
LPEHAGDVAPFRIGAFRVDPELNRLSGPGGTEQLQPRLMHVLACLAAREGAFTAREELLATVWRDTVVGEDSLTRAISSLRQALTDDPAAPRYIETIRKGGYRLLVGVEWLGAPAGTTAARPGRPGENAATTPGSAAVSERRRPRRAGLALARAGTALAIVLLAGAAAILWRHGDRAFPRRGGAASGIFLAASPLTSRAGSEAHPRLSPDGSSVVFAASDADTGGFDLRVQECGTTTGRRLTDLPGDELFPAWSPDGRLIAFAREGPVTGLAVVAAAGGAPQMLLATPAMIHGLDWSPDGARLVYATSDSGSQSVSLFALDLKSRRHAALTQPDPEFSCDHAPACSPDGRTVAFVRSDAFNTQDVYLLPAGGDSPRRLTTVRARFQGLAWAPDGASLVVSLALPGQEGLWRLGVADGRLDWLPTRAVRAIWPTIAARGHRLAFADSRVDRNVWLARLERAAEPDSALSSLIASTRSDHGAAFSPDGQRIAFVSDRSGAPEIWTCDRRGRGERQVTSFRGTPVWPPLWSPDGTRLAFTALPEGRAEVFVVEAGGGVPLAVDPEGPSQLLVDWSPDGSWLYCESPGERDWQLFRVSPSGGPRTPVDSAYRRPVGVGPDGSLYLVRREGPGIWRLAPEADRPADAAPGGADRGAAALATGGAAAAAGKGPRQAPVLAVPPEVCAGWTSTLIVPDGWLFLQESPRGRVLRFLRFGESRSRPLMLLPCGAWPRLSLSPDGREILFDRVDRFEHDLMLVEGFR